MGRAALSAPWWGSSGRTAELRGTVSGLKAVRGAEREPYCLLQGRTVQGPQMSTTAHTEKEKHVSPGN